MNRPRTRDRDSECSCADRDCDHRRQDEHDDHEAGDGRTLAESNSEDKDVWVCMKLQLKVRPHGEDVCEESEERYDPVDKVADDHSLCCRWASSELAI